MKNTLKKCREKLRMTQKEVAKLSNVSLRAYQNYEQGHRIPNTYTAIKIAEVLNIPISKGFKDTFSK